MNRIALALAALVLSGPLQDEIPSQDLRVGKDENKRYFLIGPQKNAKAPKAGFKLLVVLPGGDISADCLPFMRAIHGQSLDKEWLIAQPVAVKWTPEQGIIWPTKRIPAEKMKFTTEEFVTEIIKDVKTKHRIDIECIFTLSWSSGGPAAYTLSLEENTPITGSFVAMAVFYPQTLPPLKEAKGHGYYIYHSKEDKTRTFNLAEQARDDLKKNGAKVEFVTYEGGHGWMSPDRFADIKKGVEWLVKNHAPATTK